jgi:hypothetical protein
VLRTRIVNHPHPYGLFARDSGAAYHYRKWHDFQLFLFFSDKNAENKLIFNKKTAKINYILEKHQKLINFQRPDLGCQK